MCEVSAASIRDLISNGGPVKAIGEMHKREYVYRPIIEPVKDEDAEFIEGSAFDIRAHKVYRGVVADDFIPYMGDGGEDDLREFVEVEEVSSCYDNQKQAYVWFLLPRSRYLIESLETVNTPWYMRCIPRQKSSLMRMFCNLIYSSAHPGYCGPIVGLIDVGPFGLELKVDSKVAYVTFSSFEDDTYIEDVDLYDLRANWGTGKNVVVPKSGKIGKT